MPDRRILTGFAKPRSILLAHIPARLVLEPVMSPGEHCSTLVPDDLLMMQEADPQQSFEHLRSELRCVPDIGHFQTRDQSERIGPVRPGVAQDRRSPMPDAALF